TPGASSRRKALLRLGRGKIPIYHREVGEVDSASLFVAVMGASSYTFACAARNQNLHSWIDCHIRAFEFLEGVICEACRELADPASPEGHQQQHLTRVLRIWKLWDSTAKQKKWDSLYVGNLGDGIRAVIDLKQIAGVASWFNADHQGRSGTTPI